MSLVTSRLIENRMATKISLGHPGADSVNAYWGGQPVSSGVVVTEGNVLNFSAVWRCVALISGSVSTLPLNVYRRIDHKRSEPQFDHWANPLLNDQANPDMDAQTFRETVQGYALTWGNGVSEVEWLKSGRAKAIHPIQPRRVTPDRRPDGSIYYHVRKDGGGDDELSGSDAIHILGPSPNGVVGYSPIRVAREAIGLGMALEQYGATFFGNGTRMGGWLKTTKTLSETAQARLRDNINRMHQGVSNAHRFGILEEGMDWVANSVAPDEAQFLESRKFQMTDIARWFGVPPHLIGDLTQSTNNNIEQQALEYLQYCLRYWLCKWESRCARTLFTDAERANGLYLRHDLTELLRADINTQMDAHQKAVNSGLESVNDGRSALQMNPIGPQGDIYYIQGAMKDSQQVLAEREMETSDKDVQQTGLNGAQIASALQVAELVVAGTLAPAAAKALLAISFPETDTAKINAIIDPLEVKEPEPAPAIVPPVVPAADQPPAEPPAEDDEQKQLRAAVQGVLDDAMGRMVYREVQSARAAAKKPAEFLAWLDKFYTRQLDEMRSALVPAIRAKLLLDGEKETFAEGCAWQLANRHIEESRRLLLDISGNSTADQLATNVELCVKTWETNRTGV